MVHASAFRGQDVSACAHAQGVSPFEEVRNIPPGEANTIPEDDLWQVVLIVSAKYSVLE